MAVMGTSVTPASALRDKDCSDFKTQRQAQKFLKKHGGSKKRDPHRLDADHDGIACETSF